jgi:UDP-glucose 4-epimerase
MTVRALVTGAAGFIGSHLVRRLRDTGCEVIAFDLVDRNRAHRLADLRDDPAVSYVTGDLTDAPALVAALDGVDRVWHFGASADIAGGAARTDVDTTGSVFGTRMVCEAMRAAGVPEIVFASSSAVYGDTAGAPMRESAGPLLPRSLYGAGKVGAEAVIGAYAAMFGLRGWIFRFGNVVGGGMPRGIVRDLIIRLRQDPHRLVLLGDGRQRKSYVLVDDVLSGALYLSGRITLNDARPCDVVNVGVADSVSAREVAAVVAAELGVHPVVTAATGLSWTGDQPVVDLDVGKAARLGWRAQHDGPAAIRIATARMRELFDPDCTDASQTMTASRS